MESANELRFPAVDLVGTLGPQKSLLCDCEQIRLVCGEVRLDETVVNAAKVGRRVGQILPHLELAVGVRDPVERRHAVGDRAEPADGARYWSAWVRKPPTTLIATVNMANHSKLED